MASPWASARRFGYVTRLVAWAGIFAAQVAFSHWWLARFEFGPAEWLWRSMTYLQVQPMRRLQAKAA